jgi:hypothetical protein
LLRLSETCTTFRDVVAESTLLMRKLRIVIDMKMDPADEEAILKCIESRRFSAARVDLVNDKNTQPDLSKQDKVFEIARKLEGIKDLVIDESKTSNKLRILQLVSCLQPQKTQINRAF